MIQIFFKLVLKSSNRSSYTGKYLQDISLIFIYAISANLLNILYTPSLAPPSRTLWLLHLKWLEKQKAKGVREELKRVICAILSTKRG